MIQILIGLCLRKMTNNNNENNVEEETSSVIINENQATSTRK
jgi:hypothetical protein